MKNIILALVISLLFSSNVLVNEEFQSIELPISKPQVVLEPVKTVSAGHILVSTYEEAVSLKKRIDNGASFEKLAEQYSKCPSGKRGGALGSFGRGMMVKTFENAAFNLPVGQVSEPVKTEFGWHLIKVYDRKA